MADAVLLPALLLASGAAVLSLVRSCARRWQLERSGIPYELPVNYRGAVLRAAAAVLVAAVTAGTAGHLLAGRQPDPEAVASDPSPPDDPQPLRAHPHLPIRMPRPSGFPPLLVVRTIGHPARGTLDVLSDGTRVWLPRQYHDRPSARRAYPLIVAHLPAGGAADDLFHGFAAATERGLADPFVVALVTGCPRDPGPLLNDLGRRYRTLSGGHGRGVLGLGSAAPCAITAALRNPGRYASAAAISPDRKTVTLPGRDAGNPRNKPALLLAAAARDSSSRRSALKLRTALAPFARPRVVDAVIGPRPADDRRRLFTVASQYLTEHLDGPAPMPGSPRRSD